MSRRRRTSGIQRRERASSEALARRVDDRGGSVGGLPDWRLLAIAGLLVVGVIVVVVALIFGSGPNPNAGQVQPDDGVGHVPACEPGNYSSVPATSGCHLDTPAQWGVYSSAQDEVQLIHNLEHGGIVIWYDRDRLDQAAVDTLSQYVEAQVAQGTGGRYKFILSPWGGPEALPAPIVLTAWRHLLTMDTPDTGVINGFTTARYGDAPEPLGGP